MELRFEPVVSSLHTFFAETRVMHQRLRFAPGPGRGAGARLARGGKEGQRFTRECGIPFISRLKSRVFPA